MNPAYFISITPVIKGVISGDGFFPNSFTDTMASDIKTSSDEDFCGPWGEMKLSKRNKIIAFILIGLALVAVIFMVVRVTGEKKAKIIKILPDEADMRISDFVYTEIGQNDIRWEVKAKSAQYQKKQNLAWFDQVQIKLTTKEGRIFTMMGDKGEMLTDKKDVELKGHVVATADTGEKFSTDYLRYNDAQKKIYTDAPVMMEGKRIKIQGVGLTILMNKGELRLSSSVRARIN